MPESPKNPGLAPSHAVTAASDAFAWPLRVYIEDTDAGGIVFYANYLRYMERARTEYIRWLGFPRIDELGESSMFVVHSLSIRYLAPAFLDDELNVTANPVRIGKTWIEFEQQVYRGAVVLTEALVKVVCVDIAARRPRKMPAALAECLAAGRTIASCQAGS